MDPKGFPACVLFCFAIAFSFLAIGRIAFRAEDFAGTSPPSIEKSGPLKVAPSAPDAASSPRSAVDLKSRPPRSTILPLRANAPDQPLAAPQRVATLPDAAIAGHAAANFSLPITFEPAAPSAGHSVQYVGHGKGMTVLLESGGMEIAGRDAPGANASPSSVKLRLVNSAAQQSATSSRPSNPGPSTPQRRRKRRSGATSPTRTRRSPNRRNMPRHDTPGHAGQAPRSQRAPSQRIPRQTKPTAQLETPQGSGATSAESLRGEAKTPSAVKAIISWATILYSGARTWSISWRRGRRMCCPEWTSSLTATQKAWNTIYASR